MAIQKITEGISGAEAADIIYQNDLENAEGLAGTLKTSDINSNSLIVDSYIINDTVVVSTGAVYYSPESYPEAKTIVDMPLPVGTYAFGGFVPSAGKTFALVNELGEIKEGSIDNLTVLPKIFTIENDGFNRLRACIKARTAAEPTDEGWIHTLMLNEGTTLLPRTVKGISDVPLSATSLEPDNVVPDPVTPDNAINKRFYDSITLRLQDLTLIVSPNLAKIQNIREGLYIGSSGQKALGAGWRSYRIDVEGFSFITFGRFSIAVGGYSSFWNDSEIDGAAGSVGMIQYNGAFTDTSLPVTLAVPPTAKWLIMAAKRPANSDADSEFITINEGDELIEYVSPNDKIVAIRGYDLEGGSSNVSKFSDLIDVPPYDGNALKSLRINSAEDGLEAFDIETRIFDLPEGEAVPPPEVLVGDAWIDTTNDTIKVRRV